MPDLILVSSSQIHGWYSNLLIYLFHCRTNVNELAVTIAADEPLVTAGVIPQLIESLSKLQTKISDASNHQFYKTKTLKTHLLPLTNVAFDKRGKRYISPQFFHCVDDSYQRSLCLRHGCALPCEFNIQILPLSLLLCALLIIFQSITYSEKQLFQSQVRSYKFSWLQ